MRSSGHLAGCRPTCRAGSLALRGAREGGSSSHLLCGMLPAAPSKVPTGGVKEEKHQGRTGEGGNSLLLEAASLFPKKVVCWSGTGACLTAASWGISAWFPLARSHAPSGCFAAAVETQRGGFLLLCRESLFLPRSIASTCWEEDSPNLQAEMAAGDAEWGAINQQAAN